MTQIENSALPMMVIFFLASIAVSGYNIYVECAFRLRRKIAYKNYKYFEQFYLIKQNSYNLIAIGFILLFSLLIIGLYSWSNVVGIYCIAIIPIDLMMGVFLYYELTRKNYNNDDIVTFDSYFRDLYKIERSKTAILNKIGVVKKDFNKLSSELMARFK